LLAFNPNAKGRLGERAFTFATPLRALSFGNEPTMDAVTSSAGGGYGRLTVA
jgi:hypothetical protein